jgi:hypothetical protein
MISIMRAGTVPAFHIAGLADTYGLTFGGAEWLPDLIARYDLVPPPGAMTN